jgi:hypothetical protein
MEEDRELIAMAAIGATVTEAAAKLHTSARTIKRKARSLGIQLQGPPRQDRPEGEGEMMLFGARPLAYCRRPVSGRND